MADHNKTRNVSIFGSGQVVTDPCIRCHQVSMHAFALVYILGLAACGDTTQQPKASADASTKSITVDKESPIGSSLALENDTPSVPQPEFISADSSQFEAAVTPLLEVHHGRRPTGTGELRFGVNLRVPSLLLTANISEVPLKRVMNELARKLKAKVYIADTVRSEKISVKFKGLPLEKGIQKILHDLNYILVRAKVSALIEDDATKQHEQLAIVEIRILTNGSEFADAEFADAEFADDAEVTALAERAQKAVKAEDRLAALRRYVEVAPHSEEHSEILIPFLKDSEPQIRGLALDSLQNTVFPPFEPLAETALSDENPQLRMAALNALVNRYGDRAIPIADQALTTDSDPEVQNLAEASLDRFDRKLEQGQEQESPKK